MPTLNKHYLNANAATKFLWENHNKTFLEKVLKQENLLFKQMLEVTYVSAALNMLRGYSPTCILFKCLGVSGASTCKMLPCIWHTLWVVWLKNHWAKYFLYWCVVCKLVFIVRKRSENIIHPCCQHTNSWRLGIC